MALLFANNAITQLAANLPAAGPGSTTIVLAPGTGYVFPSPTGGDIFYGTLQTGTTIEIVAVTNRTTDTLTVIRGQDGTPTNAFPIGASFDQRVTRADLESFVQSAVSLPLSILEGGTGQTTANAAFNALAPSQTGNNGYFLTTDGSNTSWSPVSAGGVTTVGAFSGSSLTNGANISGSTITFGPADTTNPGMVSTGTQVWAGNKTIGGAVSGAPSVNAALSLKAHGSNVSNLYIEGTGGVIVPTLSMAMPGDIAEGIISYTGQGGGSAFTLSSDGNGSNFWIIPQYPDSYLRTYAGVTGNMHFASHNGVSYQDALLMGGGWAQLNLSATEYMKSDHFGGLDIYASGGVTVFNNFETSGGFIIAGSNQANPIYLNSGYSGNRPVIQLTGSGDPPRNGLDIITNISTTGTSVALKINNTTSLTTAGDELLSIQNAGVEQLGIDYQGNISFTQQGAFIDVTTNSGDITLFSGNSQEVWIPSTYPLVPGDATGVLNVNVINQPGHNDGLIFSHEQYCCRTLYFCQSRHNWKSTRPKSITSGILKFPHNQR